LVAGIGFWATHLVDFSLHIILTICNRIRDSSLDLCLQFETVAILIIKIGFLKASLRLAFKKPILVFPAPLALETPKSVS
jgi:hypothetical protein